MNNQLINKEVNSINSIFGIKNRIKNRVILFYFIKNINKHSQRPKQ